MTTGTTTMQRNQAAGELRLTNLFAGSASVATLFPNEASVLRLVSAVLSEISDDRETERSYLNLETR